MNKKRQNKQDTNATRRGRCSQNQGEMRFLTFATVSIYNCVKNKILKTRTFMIVGMFIVVIGVAFSFSIKWYSAIFPESKSLEKIGAILRDEKGVKLYRISSLFDIVSSVKMDASNFLTGWGPGASLAGAGGTKRGVIYEFPVQHKNQLSETFVDIGAVGMILYYWLLISLFGIFRRHIKLENDKSYIVLNRALMGMWLFYAIIGPFYDLIWRADSSNFIFYWLLAALYTRYRNKKNELMDITKSEYFAGE